ncbi:transport between ER and Golgi ATPase protein [Hanseniaspora valbyensis]
MDKFGFSNKLPSFGKGHTTPAPAPTLDANTYNQPAAQLFVANCPDNKFALSNVVAVNPKDFQDNVYVSIDDFYVFTTKHSNDVTPGNIGLNGNQRTWGGWSLQQPVQLKAFDLFKYTHGNPCYLGLLNLEVNFRSKMKATPQPFDQDELAQNFISRFQNQIFTPSQMLIMEFKGHVFDIRVKSLQNIDLGDVENAASSLSTGVEAKGILTRQTQIDFYKGRDGLVNLKDNGMTRLKPRSDAVIRPDFKFEDMGVGGLDKEFTQIFRRAFASRIFPPQVISKLGISHVKGLLLYGPPGTGKTLIARKIGTMLNAKEPKIVNGPEILSKYVGSSEENIRNLFKDAEQEYKAKGDESSLHIIIFDELDSVFKQRGSRGDGTGVGDNVVNQLLAKMDGVDQLNNILVIGMTNRKDLIDNALLRPGRFEVQVEIKLPDEHGRLQILEIQTKKMRDNGMIGNDVDLKELAGMTKNFSGAEIEGLVKSASSFAINKTVNIGQGKTNLNTKDIENLRVNRQDFLNALNEVVPAFGVSEEDLKTCIESGIIKYSSKIDDILKNGSRYVKQVSASEKTRLISLLFHGGSGSGKTALAASIALQSGFPFVRMISPEDTTGMNEQAKINFIDNTFRDAYKSPLNILIIDSLESLIDWVPIGPRFSNNVLQVLKVYLKRKPPKDRKLLIISTTTNYTVLKQLDLLNCFDNEIAIPNVSSYNDLDAILSATEFPDESRKTIDQLQTIIGDNLNIGIKKVLTNIETAKHDDNPTDELVELMVSSNL